MIETLKGGDVNGPWDMTSYTAGEQGVLFVTNVLNGTVAAKGKVVHGGTVVRIVLDLSVSPPKLEQELVIGNGFGEQTNATALVVGPTGVTLSQNGTLYVADTLSSRISAIPDALFRVGLAGTGTTVSSGGFLSSPLGLAIAPNGDILSVNGTNGYIVETTPKGSQNEWIYLDQTGSPPGAGALFGLALSRATRVSTSSTTTSTPCSCSTEALTPAPGPVPASADRAWVEFPGSASQKPSRAVSRAVRAASGPSTSSLAAFRRPNISKVSSCGPAVTTARGSAERAITEP